MTKITPDSILSLLYSQFGHQSDMAGVALITKDSVIGVCGNASISNNKLVQTTVRGIMTAGLIMDAVKRSGSSICRIDVDEDNRIITGRLTKVTAGYAAKKLDFELFPVIIDITPEAGHDEIAFLIHQNRNDHLVEHREACNLAADLLTRLMSK